VSLARLPTTIFLITRRCKNGKEESKEKNGKEKESNQEEKIIFR
jgi:hypothetical protein